jgi:glutathione peroxidase-family protein
MLTPPCSAARCSPAASLHRVAQTQLNALFDTFGESLAIVACPCNQFGAQENLNEEEIYSSLGACRPGNGYVPKFPLAKKLEVSRLRRDTPRDSKSQSVSHGPCGMQDAPLS